MSDTIVRTLPRICPFCMLRLMPHPIYRSADVRQCADHGDFFLQQPTGQDPFVYFRPVDGDPVLLHRQPRKVHPPAKQQEKKKDLDENPPFIDVVTPTNRVGHPGTPIRCNETGQVFPSIRKASDVLGLHASSISDHLNRGRPTAGAGFTFSRVVDGLDVPPAKPPTIKQFSVKCRCDQTGEIFPSIRAASLKMGLDRKGINDNISGRRAHVRGYTFTEIQGDKSVGDELTLNLHRAIQEIIACSRVEETEKKKEHIELAALFVRMETERILAEG